MKRTAGNVLRRNGRRSSGPSAHAEPAGPAEADVSPPTPRRGDLWLATPPGSDGAPAADVLPCVVMRTPSPGDTGVDCMVCFADDPGGASISVDSSNWGIGQEQVHFRADTGVRPLPAAVLRTRLHSLGEDEVQDLEVRAALARSGHGRNGNGSERVAARSPRLSDDPHEVLGVGSDATPEEVRAAFRRMVWLTHPDVGGDQEEFFRVTWAWRRLQP